MLPRPLRLSRTEIKQVLKEGRSWVGKVMSARLRPVEKTTPSKFALVVSNQVAKKASDRQQLKRHLRHIIRQLSSSIQPGYHIIIFTKPLARSLTFKSLHLETLSFLQNLNLINI